MIAMNDKQKFNKVQELVYELKVKDAMAKNVITATPRTLMKELRGILKSHKISGTPIVKKGKLVGIISIEDFITWLGEGGVNSQIKDRMTTDVKTLYTDEPLIKAVCKLDETGFGRFPVIERHTGELVGVLTKGDIVVALLHKLEIGYHEEEIHHYRASHIFEDIVADRTTLIFQYYVKGKDFNNAGRASSELKKTLTRLGLDPLIIRRAVIASYEAEMNVVIYTNGGEMTVKVEPKRISIDIKDAGPGIPDIQKALEPGYSTAPEWVRELGFGAGMGLPNIQKCADTFNLTSKLGKGTYLNININIKANQ